MWLWYFSRQTWNFQVEQTIFFINHKPWMFFVETVFLEPSTLDFFFWPAWWPHVNQQPCLPYLFGGHQKAQWEWSTLPAFFFLTDRRPSVSDQPCMFFKTINMACFVFNQEPFIFFLPNRKARCERSTLPALFFWGTDRGPSVNDQPCLPYFFWNNRRPSVNDQPCLPWLFLWTDRRPSVNDQPYIFFAASTKGQCKQWTLHVFKTINLACFF